MPTSPSPSELAWALVRQGLAPAVAAGCSVRRGDGWVRSTGGDTALLFDLASLTKPMTAVAVARSSEVLPRTTRLQEALPELRGTFAGEAPIEDLLAHRAGLTAHIAVYEPRVRGVPVDPAAAMAAAADARRAECRGPRPEGGFLPVYSDLGYALAGAALARRLDALDAGAAIERKVAAPLGVSTSLGTARELASRGVPVARLTPPTEEVAWRGGLVRGAVHDENAWVLTGEGGSGHAGMFGTVDAVLAFGQAVLDGLEGRGAFAADDLAWLVAERPHGTLRAGFDGKSPEGSSAGARFSPRSFGHLGFTGTSLWVDPDAHVVAVLLTNRVFPHRDRAARAIKDARPRAHDALHAYATSRRDGQ